MQLRRHHQKERVFGHQTDGLERFDRVKFQFVQVRVDGLTAERGHEQGIAVRRCSGHKFCSQIASRTRFVVHHHRLPQQLRHAKRHQARQFVGRSASGKAHHNFDRFSGIALRQRMATSSKRNTEQYFFQLFRQHGKAFINKVKNQLGFIKQSNISP